MRIGIDFDNTIVSYDALFHKVAREAGLVPESVAATKVAVRDYLREIGREDDWTKRARIPMCSLSCGRRDVRAMNCLSSATRPDTRFVASHMTFIRPPEAGLKARCGTVRAL